MKALSIWQPWASLIAMGLKRFETRSWQTSYRGPLLICSAKKRLSKADFIDKAWLHVAPSTYETLPFGQALCIVDLSRIYTTDHVILSSWPSIHDMNPPLSEKERALGDFSPRRFALELQNIRRFKEPWPWPGALGLFNVPDEEVAKHEMEE